MCGRFTIALSKNDLFKYLNDTFNINSFHTEITLPKYNVAPTQNIIAVIHDGVKFRVGEIRWGLIPSFQKNMDSKYNIINARKDKLLEKGFYKELIEHRRCLIISNGFYEWEKTENGSRPYYITLKNNNVFTFAGIYSKSIIDGKSMFSCAIITTEANELMGKIHQRMPVILHQETQKEWLYNHNLSDNQLMELLTKYPSNDLKMIPVSTLINNVKNDSIECLRPFQS